MKQFALLLVLLCVAAFPTGRRYSAVQDTTTKAWSIVEGDAGIAWALLKDHAEVSGWNILDVVTNAKYEDNTQAYAAGFVEGGLTHHLIWQAWKNFEDTNLPGFPAQFVTFITNNDKWVRQMVLNPPTGEEDYWFHVGLVLQQVDGLLDGYNAYSPPEQQLTATNLLTYELSCEIGDIETSLNLAGKRNLPYYQDAHCSSIVKPSDDGTKLFASHVTWTGYTQMLRIFKHYTTNFQTPSNAAATSSFSSSPGSLPSGDDYYITSSKLVVMETTNSVMNNTLFTKYVTEQTVMYWIRVIVANQMASSGEEWTKYFAMYNSGTYNNQWIVVDYKKFTPGKPLQPGTLWIAEQIPGYVVSADKTDVVVNTGYWSSYNIPYFPFIYNISNYPTYYEKYGDSYSYGKCARAQIFKRDESAANTLEGIKKLMRYNQYQTDPLSLQDACRGISARCDLNTPWTPNSLNGAAAFGAIDGKATDNTMVNQLETAAVSGPSWDSQPPFAWTEQWQSVPHHGQPKVFAFNWIRLRPETK